MFFGNCILKPYSLEIDNKNLKAEANLIRAAVFDLATLTLNCYAV